MRLKIIAEAGVNHNGDVSTALKLVEAAKKSGADYIKFQTFKAVDLVIGSATQAKYQENNTNIKESQLSMLKKLELKERDFKEIFEYCQKLNIGFLSSGFSPRDFSVLNQFEMDYLKIPSGEITNILLLEYVARNRNNSKILISTGMSKLKEVEEAINILKKRGISEKSIALLHCTTEYPAPLDSINLRAMMTLKKQFKCEVGYSDHTEGKDVSIAAVAMGATIIEKHFTLDRGMKGPDHKASLDVKGFSSMVKSLRNTYLALGNSLKEITYAEKENILIVRKSLVALKRIKKGELFTMQNLGIKRPGNGVSPMKYYEYLGNISMKDYDPNEVI